jgi:succinate dehydrogenase / fumarate reductase iron-sulfur subunit
MVEAMEQEGFGYCSNFAECEAVCPKEISIDFIARMNKDYLKAKSKGMMKVPMES